MLQLTLLLLAALLLVNNSEACSRTRRTPTSGGVVVGNPNNPPGAPPTPNPTPVPPPPAVPEGWVQPPPPSNMLQQGMTRTNCIKRVIFDVIQEEGESQAATIEDIKEVWEYTCTFRVCSEVDMTGEKGECSCAMFATNTGGSTYANQDYLEYSTEVKRAKFYVWNVNTRAIVDTMPGWDFSESPHQDEISRNLATAAAGDMQYANAIKSFTGDISNSTLPASLDQTNFANQGNVPAICFYVEQRYTTTTRWPRTRMPIMYSDPSLWTTACVPVYDWDPNNVFTGDIPAGSAKRQAAEATKQRYFKKTFMLFAMGDADAALSAHIPAGLTRDNRMLEAYYQNSACTSVSGHFTVDSRFSQVIERESQHDIIGAFQWERTYTSRWFVGGVPRAFSNPAQFWATGYHKVQWLENYSRVDGVGNFRPGVLYRHLMGDCTSEGPNKNFANCDKKWKICNKLPASWKTCEAGGNGCDIVKQPEVFGETALFYPITKGEVECPGFDNLQCDVERTFFSFQNFGGLARDYEKHTDSWMVVAPRMKNCEYPKLKVFDNLPFTAYSSGTQLKKRNALGKTFAKNIHYNERGEMMALSNQQNDDFAMGAPQTPFDTTVGKGGLDMDLGFRVALGSTDNGKPAGDHPLELFPEQYAAPVSLDPNNPEEAPESSHVALAWDGQAPPCIKGTQGCACRDQRNTRRPECDEPLACEAGDGGNFCVIPSCPVGTAGCKCNGNGGCAEGHLSCNDGSCTFSQLCTAGTAGCAATAQGECTDGSFVQFKADGSLVCAFRKCTVGAPGCACEEDADICSSGACVNKMCQGTGIPAGLFGGPCLDGAEPCELGFMCEKGTCVPNTCENGESGCTCTDSCKDEDAICGEDNQCMKKSCRPGSPGCSCSVGQCSEGFECSYEQDKTKGRCVENRCDLGEPGCPCKTDKSCNKPSFKCTSLKKDGSVERCMSTGVDCETPRDALCEEYCGAGRIKSCHPCSGVVPECIEDSANVVYVATAIALAVVAALF